MALGTALSAMVLHPAKAEGQSTQELKPLHSTSYVGTAPASYHKTRPERSHSHKKDYGGEHLLTITPASIRNHSQPERFWYGEASYFNALTKQEKHNALMIYQVGLAMHETVQEIGCTDNITYRESKDEVTATNDSTGAYGMGQALPGDKMASAGKNWMHSARTQAEWIVDYVKGRYGSACAAWGYWLVHSNY